jgi:glycine cleavage system H protein
MTAELPSDLVFTKDHEWARIDGKTATIGITMFAVEQLGDITQVDLPKEGETIKKGEAFGSVESVKAVSDLYAPLTGKIIKVNSPLSDSPEGLQEDPYDDAWLIQIELSDPKEAKDLMSPDKYAEFLREQEDH